jgi:6-pyruvoyltetrahydropterin/6-carboxytetrahydropterin synthase
MLDDIVSEFDNRALNEISYFRQNNPSAENVARYIYEKLRAKLPESVKLQNIRVVEEPGCAANFSESQ